MLANDTFRNMVRFRRMWIQYNTTIHRDIRVAMENFVQTDPSFMINPQNLVLTGALWGNWYALIISRFSLTHQWIHHNKNKSLYLYRNFMTYTPHVPLTYVLLWVVLGYHWHVMGHLLLLHLQCLFWLIDCMDVEWLDSSFPSCGLFWHLTSR